MAATRTGSFYLWFLASLAVARPVQAKAPAPGEQHSVEQQRRALVLHRLTSLGNDRVRDHGKRIVRASQTVGWLGEHGRPGLTAEAAFAALLGEGELSFEERGGRVQVLWKAGVGSRLLGQLRTVGGEEIFVPTKGVAAETRRTIGEALLVAVERLARRPERPIVDSTWLEGVEDPKAPEGTRRISFEPRWKVAHGGVERPDWTYGGHAADALRGPLATISELLYPRPGLGARVAVAWTSDRRRDGSRAPEGHQIEHRLTFRPSYRGGGALYEESAFAPGQPTGSRARRREARQHAGWWKDQLERAKHGQVPEREWAVAQVVLHAKADAAGRKRTVPNLARAGLYGDGKLVFEKRPEKGGRGKGGRDVFWERRDGTRVALGGLTEQDGAPVFEPGSELLAHRNATVGEALLGAVASRSTWQPYDYRDGARVPQSSPQREAGLKYFVAGERLARTLEAALPPGLRELLTVERYGKPVELRWLSSTPPAHWSRYSERKIRDDQVVEHTLQLSDEPFRGPHLVYGATIRYRFPALQAPRRLEEVADRSISIDAAKMFTYITRTAEVAALTKREEIETYVARLYLEHTHFGDDVAGIYAEALSTRRDGAWKLADGTEPLWREAFAQVGCISAKEALQRVGRRPAWKALVRQLGEREAASKGAMWHEIAVKSLASREEIRTFIALYRHLFPDLGLGYIYNGGVNGHAHWRAFAPGTKELWLSELRTAGAFDHPLR